jgi:hypothetical protein
MVDDSCSSKSQKTACIFSLITLRLTCKNKELPLHYALTECLPSLLTNSFTYSNLNIETPFSLGVRFLESTVGFQNRIFE